MSHVTDHIAQILTRNLSSELRVTPNTLYSALPADTDTQIELENPDSFRIRVVPHEGKKLGRKVKTYRVRVLVEEVS